MIVMLKMNPAEYGCKLQGLPTAPQVAKVGLMLFV